MRRSSRRAWPTRPIPLAARALVGTVNKVVTHLLAQARDPRQATSFVIEIVERHVARNIHETLCCERR
jgi:hypothetical protein